MNLYSYFAHYYDRLIQNVDYSAYADYILKLLEHCQHKPGLMLDIACGTGNLMFELFERGIDIYGVDASPEMLMQAKDKAYGRNIDMLFLCQKIQDLDLYGSVDTVVCTLDGLNHLKNAEEVRRTFERVHLFLDPGGYFLFDMNTIYKHREVLADNVFVYEADHLFCVWQNHYLGEKLATDVELDFFEKTGKNYERCRDSFTERAYETEDIKKWLYEAGFSQVDVYHEFTFDEPRDDSQRLVYMAKKQQRI